MSQPSKQILVQTKNLCKFFTLGRQQLQAVKHVHLTIYQGETLGLVGESGSGKSTVGRLLLRLQAPTEGHVYFQGQDLAQCSHSHMKQLRQKMQMIFQDPTGSLNPRMTILDSVAEPLDIHGLAQDRRTERVIELLQLVGLDSSHLLRLPHEFSGGQRQRICIARALASHPQFIVCDEPLSSLDVSVQAQVINLLRQLQATMGLTLLFIGHDLAVIKYLCDRVAVMYFGEIVELAANEELYKTPLHPYTQALLSCISIPHPIEARQRKPLLIQAPPPNPLQPPQGCPFATRCPHAREICKKEKPAWQQVSPSHGVACHLFSP